MYSIKLNKEKDVIVQLWDIAGKRLECLDSGLGTPYALEQREKGVCIVEYERDAFGGDSPTKLTLWDSESQARDVFNVLVERYLEQRREEKRSEYNKGIDFRDMDAHDMLDFENGLIES